MRKILKLLICISIVLSFVSCENPKTILGIDVAEFKKEIRQIESVENIKIEQQLGRIFFKVYLYEGYTEEEINEIYEKVVEFANIEKMEEILEKMDLPVSFSDVNLDFYAEEKRVYEYVGSCYANGTSKSAERDYDYYVWSGGKVEVGEDSTEETEGNEEETTEKQSGQKE